MNKTATIYSIMLWSMVLVMMAGCSTSKIFPPQDTTTTPREGFLSEEQMDIAFFDSRTDKKQSDEVKHSIMHHLHKTYPNVTFHLLDDSGYLANAEDGKIALKINIVDYIVTFNNAADNGHWQGRTGISVTLHDNRNSGEKYTNEIFDEDSRPTGIANITPKKALQTSFQGVMNRLTAFIDQSLMG